MRAPAPTPIRDLTSRMVVTVGPAHTLAEAARRMNSAKVGSAAVATEDGRPGIITERDVLRGVAEGANPEETSVEAYMTANAITAAESWDIYKAAKLMLDGGFRHLVVVGESGRSQACCLSETSSSTSCPSFRTQKRPPNSVARPR
jgi:CBS domain-containing protein